MTVVNLKKTELPDDLIHKEVVSLKDLDATFQELGADDKVDDIDTKKQASACPLFVLDLENYNF